MYKVRKRDGKIVTFDIQKIASAMISAFEAEAVNFDENVVDFLALKVTADFQEKIKDNIVNGRRRRQGCRSNFCRSRRLNDYPACRIAPITCSGDTITYPSERSLRMHAVSH